MHAKNQKCGLLSIRNRFLIFSILVTLVPSFGMGWFFYDMTYMAMAEKTQQRFHDTSEKVEREIGLWISERGNDLRTFANSFVLIDNLTKYQDMKGGDTPPADKKQVVDPVSNIANYLDFVRNKFSDYHRLAVFDREGREIAGSAADAGARKFSLPVDWKVDAGTDKVFVGNVTYGKDKKAPLAVIGIVLFSDQTNKQLGALAVQIDLQRLLPFLKVALAESGTAPGSICLVQNDGRSMLSAVQPEEHMEARLSKKENRVLLSRPQQLQNMEKKTIVGFAQPFKNLPWAVIITRNYDALFADVIHLRDRIVMLVVAFALAIGLGASIFSRQILRPLKELTSGVLRVAEGELDVRLEVMRHDELGMVSEMFNEMVVKLKENKLELEQLAVTDPLTKLANRKKIMTELHTHIENYRRYGTKFSLLMVDIDHFKTVNDTYGHQTGDAVLCELAQIFHKLLRNLDVASRYGGEEFLILLGQTSLQEAMVTAERIRHAVEQRQFVYGDTELRITISVGVSGIEGVKDTDSSLIGRADNALYVAKTTGRNKVAQHLD